MPINVKCPTCGKSLKAPEAAIGKKAKCSGCNCIFTVTTPEEDLIFTEEVQETSRPTYSQPSAKPAIPGLKSMQCQSCGGTVEYKDGQGLFKCKYCSSVYESEVSSDGGFAIRTVMIKKLEKIEKHTETTSQIMTEERLQKKGQQVQDKIDYKYVEFENSTPRKLATAAPIVILGGIILFFVGFGQKGFGIVLCIIVALILIGLGVLFFKNFKQAKATFEQEVVEVKQKELEPIFKRLKEIGSVMEDGNVALGYTESTTVPMRYCVCCHENITPLKQSGASFAGLSGINLILTIFTCGLWIPAWFLIEILARGSRMAKRAVQKGTCPKCGNNILFAARIPNV